MGRSSYSQSVSSSTRTFQTAPRPTEEQATKLTPPASNRSKTVRRFVVRHLPWLLIAVLVIISLFLFVQYREAQSKLLPSHLAQSNAKKVQETLTKVAQLAVVPSNETPTVVTIADVSKLKNQSFFVNAKTGDKIIVYARTKQAILYRPSTNQIVNMALTTSAAQ